MRDDDYKLDVHAIMASLARGDVDGTVMLYQQMGIDASSRVGRIVSGMAGYVIGIAEHAVANRGTPQEEVSSEARLLIMQIARESSRQ